MRGLSSVWISYSEWTHKRSHTKLGRQAEVSTCERLPENTAQIYRQGTASHRVLHSSRPASYSQPDHRVFALAPLQYPANIRPKGCQCPVARLLPTTERANPPLSQVVGPSVCLLSPQRQYTTPTRVCPHSKPEHNSEALTSWYSSLYLTETVSPCHICPNFFSLGLAGAACSQSKALLLAAFMYVLDRDGRVIHKFLGCKLEVSRLQTWLGLELPWYRTVH